MGKILDKGTLFRIEDIAAPSPEWSEYCHQYVVHGNPEPKVFDGEEIRVIYFREKMLGGFISSRRHSRYRSYLDKSDTEAQQRFDEITWNSEICNFSNVISINCLWRRIDSGFFGRLATIVLYLWIMNRARYSDCKILVGAANAKLRKLYSSWNPVSSFNYKHTDGSIRDIFLFEPDSAIAAVSNSTANLLFLKWLIRSEKRPSELHSTDSGSIGKAA